MRTRDLPFDPNSSCDEQLDHTPEALREQIDHETEVAARLIACVCLGLSRKEREAYLLELVDLFYRELEMDTPDVPSAGPCSGIKASSTSIKRSQSLT